jgi:tetratricopeptide (TPR) repeat protein
MGLIKLFEQILFAGIVSISTFCATTLFSEIPESALQFMPPMNVIYHPVSTTNPEAQKSFDKGLTYIFAFNHDVAFLAFENAAKIDPNLAMAYWGMALALGQNMNEDVTPENEIKAYNYIQKAIQLAPNATRMEQDYISALATRYSNDPAADLVSLRFRYRDAMKKLIQAYPEDLDASTLYAESILNLDPWKWWTPEGKPKDGTMEAIDVLDSVLLRNPEHIGANHYNIHAFEESPYPQRALMSAHRLEYLLPESGHLLHMPCHIFLLVGDYNSALATNKKAIAQDKAYFQKFGMSAGHYPLHYLSHNLYLQTRIYMLMEDYENAIKTAFEVVNFVAPHLEEMPTLAYRSTIPIEVNLYFHKWDEILAYQLNSKYPPAIAYWHYSRALAYANLGDLTSAQKEKELMMQAKNEINPNDSIANNPAVNLINFIAILLDAAMAHAQKNDSASIEYLKKAVEVQNQFFYDEPPAYFTSANQLLGFSLLEQKRYQEAEMAFRKALKHLQRNGRNLFGLFLSLKGQGRTMDAYWVEREMNAALKIDQT